MRAALPISILLLGAGAAQGQASDEPAPDAQEVVADALADPVRLPPLLLEGTSLTAAQGALRRDDASGLWRFHVDAAEPGVAGYELTLLPCARLRDMESVVERNPGVEVVFELSGEVYAYRDRNFVLPTYAPHRVVEPEPEPEADPIAPDAGDSVDDIIANLEAAVGPLVQDPGRAEDLIAGPSSGDRTFLLWRRGRLVRAENGTWLFVFDADAEGLADPPAIVLPCRTRERMETAALRGGGSIELVLSGRVFEYRGTRYVMPDVFRSPNERSKLTP